MKMLILVQQPVALDGIYPDEYIEFWGEIFTANPFLSRAGLAFKDFLRDPHVLFREALYAPIAARSPGLLAAQRAVQRRLDAAAASEQLELAMDAVIVELAHAGGHCENGRWIEPLHHHAHPRNVKRTQHQEA